MIDSPGHVDFNSDVTTALRITDGALVVVDAVEGVCVQTKTVVCQALAEGVRLVLVLNKVDRLLSQLMFTPKEVLDHLNIVIAGVNSLITSFCNKHPSVPRHPPVSLASGTVCFGSGYYGWMACVHTAACLFSRGGAQQDAKTRFTKAFARLTTTDSTQTKEENQTSSLHPSGVDTFCRVVLQPIMQLHKLVEQIPRPEKEIQNLLSKVGICVSTASLSGSPRTVLRAILSQLLPVSQCLLHLISTHLPSPSRAQAIKCRMLYTGPQDDIFARGIRNCDSDGPVVMFVCKMLPMAGTRNSSVALGRVLSGTVRPGMQVSVLVPDDGDEGDDDGDANIEGVSDEDQNDVDEPASDDNNNNNNNKQVSGFKSTPGRLSRVLTVLGHGFRSASSISAGMVCGVMGVDDALTTTGTITSPLPNPFPIASMKFAVRPIVRVAVKALHGGNGTTRLIQALDMLRRTDPGVRCIIDNETKEHVLAATGELHLDVCVTELRRLCDGIELWVSPARISHREGITTTSTIQQCLVKTANKHNRFWFRASPLADGLVREISKSNSKKIGSVDMLVNPKDPVARARYLSDTFGWDNNHARKIVVLGGKEFGTNVLVDCTTGVQHMSEVRDMLVCAFRSLCMTGPLCGEPLYGVRVDILDAKIHSEGAQRRAAQIVPASVRGMAASILCAGAVLIEPWVVADIHASEEQDCCGQVFTALASSRAEIVPPPQQQQGLGGGSDVRALVPAVEGRTLANNLRSETRGRAMMSCRFAQWRKMGLQESLARALQVKTQKSMPHSQNMWDPMSMIDSL